MMESMMSDEIEEVGVVSSQVVRTGTGSLPTC